MIWINQWNRAQRGEALDLVEMAKDFWGVDVSQYVKPKKGMKLNRFRRERVGHDGTSAFTVEAMQNLILPIVNRTVYDKYNGEPNGCETGIVYHVSPIVTKSTFRIGEFKSGHKGLMQRETFYMRYTSYFIYDGGDKC